MKTYMILNIFENAYQDINKNILDFKRNTPRGGMSIWVGFDPSYFYTSSNRKLTQLHTSINLCYILKK